MGLARNFSLSSMSEMLPASCWTVLAAFARASRGSGFAKGEVSTRFEYLAIHRQ